jgi:hypothetical protein
MQEEPTEMFEQVIVNSENGRHTDKETIYSGSMIHDLCNHADEETKNLTILELTNLEYSERSGELIATILYNSGTEHTIDAKLLREDEPLKLATYIRHHPVEWLQTGYRNEWSRSFLSSKGFHIRRLNAMYQSKDMTHSRAYHQRRNKCDNNTTERREMMFGVALP